MLEGTALVLVDGTRPSSHASGRNHFTFASFINRTWVIWFSFPKLTSVCTWPLEIYNWQLLTIIANMYALTLLPRLRIWSSLPCKEVESQCVFIFYWLIQNYILQNALSHLLSFLETNVFTCHSLNTE